MKAPYIIALSTVLIMATACRENTTQNASEASIANGSGGARPLPADVLLVTNAIVDGQLYSRPSFNGISVARFDTSHQIQVLDTADQLFVRARVLKDSTAFTGYVSKAILPEKR